MSNGEAISYWLESAKKNIEVAKDNFDLKPYDWSLFFWHLAIRKSTQINTN